MNYPVIKSTAYVLVHTPDMVIHNGTTQTIERSIKPDSQYLCSLGQYIRNYEAVLHYAPNQVYIGNMTSDDLKKYKLPWYDKIVPEAKRFGKFGEIMPQDEFIGLMKVSDAFDLVNLEKNFTVKLKGKFRNHPLFKKIAEKLEEGEDIEEIQEVISDKGGEGLYHNGQIVGCVKRAHDIDINLTSKVMLENLATKASGILSLKHLIDKADIDAEDIQYIIECSEEACGDMNQRGGGNFAKSIAEGAGAINASGSDTRGFCAAPVHAIIEAAALVQAGIYENVAVVAGGSLAKLGLNAKDHVKKQMPVLEDVLGGFAILIGKNDGKNPIIRTDLIGRHTVGTGSSPLAVIQSLVAIPLDKGGLRITDIDKYSVEMQNPDITIPAGIGDVAEANYKIIGALGVQRKEIESHQLNMFIDRHGLIGWAPTQGHIPSGIPYVGFARHNLMHGTFNRTMIIGKGSLFLGRMTNIFDGISFILERNPGIEEVTEVGFTQKEIKDMIADAMRDFASHLLKE